MDKSYSLVRLADFDTTFLNTFRFYEYKSSLDRAEKFENAVYQCIETISINPHTFQVRYKDIRAGRIPRFPYLILYQIDEHKKQIQFTRIVGQSQDWLRNT